MRLLHVTLALCLLLPPLSQGQTAAPVPAATTYAVSSPEEFMVPMRDGVHLATDVYYPMLDGRRAPGRFPVILLRTPYNKRTRTGEIAGLVSAGFIFVSQDVRGRYRSEGRWVPLRDDPADGYDTAGWIGAQAWSNQRIGTIGTSYEGGTQHALAIAGAPYVQAMVPRNAMSDFGRYGVRHNGAFELRWVNWVLTLGNATGTPDAPLAAMRAAADPAAAPGLATLGEHVREYVRDLPLRAGTTPLKFAPDYEAWLLEAMRHGEYDAFWRDHGASVMDHLPEYKDIPVYHITGWYDSWGTPVANLNYPGLVRTKRSLQRLIIGPWIHSSERLDYAGEAQFTPEAALDLPALYRRWFGHWLQDEGNGVEQEAPVRIYVMGGGDAHRTPEGRIFVGGHWRDEQEWPLARARTTPYYLHAGGGLSPAAPGAEEPTRYLFDPHNPVPTLGGNLSSQGKLAFQGAADQRGHAGFWLTPDTRPLSTRPDVLVFQTEPLTQDTEVTGRIIVKLWASSQARDTDFTAKLIDVYPPNRDFPEGVDLSLGDSIVRARYREGGEKAQLLEPGRPYEFTIELYPTSILFQRGHRIRVDISSSNFPRFDVNPNTGGDPGTERRWQTTENTIYTDQAHPSHILLPIIPK